jgi:NTE family protein
MDEKIDSQEQNKKILVISGGGLKGFAGLGSLKCLIDNYLIDTINTFAGTSVGSVICFLYNIGYDPKDVYDVLEQIDFTKLIKYIEPDNLFGEPCFGLSSPEPILNSIYSFMKKKNIGKNLTFKQLYDMTKKTLIITGTCINDTNVKYFSYITSPNMQILKALRITISIPFIFRPYQYDRKLWVDGGVMNNFPIDLFSDRLDDVIAIYLDDVCDSIDEIEEIQDYFKRIFKCLSRGLNLVKTELFKKYIVHVKIPYNHSTNWEITQAEKKMLYDLGYSQATEYIEKYINNIN